MKHSEYTLYLKPKFAVKNAQKLTSMQVYTIHRETHDMNKQQEVDFFCLNIYMDTQKITKSQMCHYFFWLLFTTINSFTVLYFIVICGRFFCCCSQQAEEKQWTMTISEDPPVRHYVVSEQASAAEVKVSDNV